MTPLGQTGSNLQAGGAQAWQEDLRSYLGAQPSIEGQSQRKFLADALLSAGHTGPDAAARWWATSAFRIQHKCTHDVPDPCCYVLAE